MFDILHIINRELLIACKNSMWFNVFIRIVVLMAILQIITLIFNKIQKRLLSKTDEIEAIKQIKTTLRLVHMVINTFVVLSALIAFLASVGVNIKPFLATAGVAGIAVGYAAKRFLEDIISGIIIITSGQIRMGDYVNISGKEGTVENIDLKMVTLRGINGNVHFIRNGLIDIVTNYTRDYSYFLLDLGVSYDEDPDKVMAVLKDIFDKELMADTKIAPKILGDIEICGLNSFENSSIIIRIRIKTVPKEQWAVQRAFNRLILQRFKEENIEIPYPYQNVLIKNS
ncbi:MAG: mechanosensitive ion channel family protein [Candidatus Gastranaerophilales bacterium]|nr:mechanosensitive ion channel family protein [Candidatus Gastranaerophilales bacterium]